MSNNFIEDYEILIQLCNENKILEIKDLLLKMDLDINGNLIMSQLCKENNVKAVLILYPLFDWHIKIFDDNDCYDYESVFCHCCRLGYIDIAKNLYSNFDINIKDRNEEAFCLACQEGHDDIVEWIMEVYPTIDVSIDNNFCFQLACKKGYLSIIKLLLKKNNDINFKDNFNYAIIKACQNGNFELIIWFHSYYLKLYDNTDDDNFISTSISEIFYSTINSKIESIEILEWLLKIEPSFLDTLKENFESITLFKIRNVIEYDKLETIKWIINIYPELNELIENEKSHIILNLCKKSKSVKIITWLNEKFPTLIADNHVDIVNAVTCNQNGIEIFDYIINLDLENLEINFPNSYLSTIIIKSVPLTPMVALGVFMFTLCREFFAICPEAYLTAPKVAFMLKEPVCVLGSYINSSIVNLLFSRTSTLVSSIKSSLNSPFLVIIPSYIKRSKPTFPVYFSDSLLMVLLPAASATCPIVVAFA